MIVQIWDVDQDQKHSVIASKQINGSSRAGLPNQTLQEVGRWVIEQITQKYDLNAVEVRVHVHVPADLGKEKIKLDMTPPGPLNKYAYIVEPGNKSRIPLDEQALAMFGKDFTLEIHRPGYEARPIPVTWGQVLNEDVTLQPLAIRIGIEEFAGERNLLATWLSDYLTSNSRISVKDPSTLKALQESIAKEKEAIARNPAIQGGYRTSLGMDLIITGRYEKP